MWTIVIRMIVGIGMVRIQYMIRNAAVRYAAFLTCGKFLCDGLIETGEAPCFESVVCDIAKEVLSRVGNALAENFVDGLQSPLGPADWVW